MAGFQVTTGTNFGNITTGTGGSGFGLPSGTGTRTTGTTGDRGAAAANIIGSVGDALSGLGAMIGNIITSVGTSRAIQAGNYYSPYNQGQYNSNNNVTIALVAIAAVGILLVTKK